LEKTPAFVGRRERQNKKLIKIMTEHMNRQEVWVVGRVKKWVWF